MVQPLVFFPLSVQHKVLQFHHISHLLKMDDSEDSDCCIIEVPAAKNVDRLLSSDRGYDALSSTEVSADLIKDKCSQFVLTILNNNSYLLLLSSTGLEFKCLYCCDL